MHKAPFSGILFLLVKSFFFLPYILALAYMAGGFFGACLCKDGGIKRNEGKDMISVWIIASRTVCLVLFPGLFVKGSVLACSISLCLCSLGS